MPEARHLFVERQEPQQVRPFGLELPPHAHLDFVFVVVFHTSICTTHACSRFGRIKIAAVVGIKIQDRIPEQIQAAQPDRGQNRRELPLGGENRGQRCNPIVGKNQALEFGIVGQDLGQQVGHGGTCQIAPLDLQYLQGVLESGLWVQQIPDQVKIGTATLFVLAIAIAITIGRMVFVVIVMVVVMIMIRTTIVEIP